MEFSPENSAPKSGGSTQIKSKSSVLGGTAGVSPLRVPSMTEKHPLTRHIHQES